MNGSFEIQGQLSPSKLHTVSLKLDRLELQGHDFHYFNSRPLVIESRKDIILLHPFILSGTNTQIALQGQKKQQGALSPEHANTFQLIIWSAGDYFGNITTGEDRALIANYGKGVLVEGSDEGGLDGVENDLDRDIAFASDLIQGGGELGAGN